MVASLAIGEGARRAALADIGALGIDNVFVRAVADRGASDEAAAAPELTMADATAIDAGIGGVEMVATGRFTRAEVSVGDRHATASVAGVGPAWFRLANVECARGRCLADEDARRSRRVAVLGASLAAALAPRGDPVGLSIATGGQFYEVVGVLQASDRRPGAAALQAFNPDEAVMVPVAVMDTTLGEGDRADRVSEIAIRAAGGTDVAVVGASVARVLARRHPDASDRYELVVPRELLRARLRAQRTFDAVLLATGVIALLIAGVGIMNVMLASVTERRQEIGVRLAVGARQRDVVAQFTVEAGMLCLGGGACGVPLGAALSWAVSLFAGWPVAISVSGVALALVLAASVGLAFGIYPAYLAASNDPVEALRA